MANNDLLQWVTSDIDFYELLGITFEGCSESELRRAYRKTALKYHPDKVGKDFDPGKYELFQAANDVLSDPELKAKYDSHRNAKIQRQRANELFEGKRRQMKEDLEARERSGGAGGLGGGMKRSREEDAESEMLRKLAEEGRKRRAKRASMMGDSVRAATSSPAPPSPRKQTPPPAVEAQPKEQPQEDEMEKRERELMERIREAEAAKAKRKAEKKARRSGIFVPADSPSVGEEAKFADRDTATPIKRPDIFKGLKADEKSSASPKFSFSPSSNTPQKNDFAATMARLKAAEKQRLEEQIRQQDAEAAN
jgi:DnaJ family protein C protein 17